MSWIKTNYVPLLMVIASCLVGIVLFEVTLRIVNSNDPWNKTREANILRDVHFTYDIGQLYEADASSVDYVRNQYGLRDACQSLSQMTF